MSWPPPPSDIGEFVVGYSAIDPQQVISPALLKAIRAYVYWEYQDDDNVTALFTAFNQLAQQLADWFNALCLPNYIGETVSGQLLDWVGEGLYGLPRPTIARETVRRRGAIGTYVTGTLPIGVDRRTVNATYQLVDDDVYRRVLTWHVYKGDGWTFTVRWLKRRIERFLDGFNGVDVPVGDTRLLSVSFGAGPPIRVTQKRTSVRRVGAIGTYRVGTNTIGASRSVLVDRYSAMPKIPLTQINITLLTHRATVVGGAIVGRYRVGGGGPIGALRSGTARIAQQKSMAQTFKAAVEQGVLALPLQFSYVVTAQP